MTSFQLETLAALVAGFAFAGLVLEITAAFTAEVIGFDLFFRHGRRGWLALPLLFMTGPMVLLRDAWTRWPERGSALGGALAVAWSIASGHLLLTIIRLVNATGFYGG